LAFPSVTAKRRKELAAIRAELTSRGGDRA
jgi:hypothetical protein